MKEMFTAKQLAKYLQLKPVTIRRKAIRGEIPAVKIGRQLRFDKAQIDKWLSKSNIKKDSAPILVVDDEPIIGTLFRNTLQGEGYQVITVLHSLEAVEIINNKRFALIFLDLVMPELDGSELFKLIRKKDRSVPVVIITGYPDSDILARAMKYGPVIVLKKPFQSEEIAETTRSYYKGFYNNH